MAEDVVDAPAPALALDLPPRRAARVPDVVLAGEVLLLAARGVGPAAGTPRPVAHRIAVDRDPLAVQGQLADDVTELVEVWRLHERWLARREAARLVHAPVL